MKRLVFVLMMMLIPIISVSAQQPMKRPPTITSPEISEANPTSTTRKVTFRMYAPKAEKVTLVSSDIPNNAKGNAGREFKKDDNQVWELSLAVAPGSYRYLIEVDGLRVVDPRNTAISESNATVWSLVRVPGATFMDTNDVPHGAVSSITYHSKSLGKLRRAHVYTPPGYETGSDKYPVFYLLHGAGDSDHSWTSVGRAHDILDNLIAAKKATPMIVVMPAGHTGPFNFGGPPMPKGKEPTARFEDDFEKDLRPLIEKLYRVKTDRANRAIAGLSMGGGQTLSLFVAKPTDYGAVGVFSSGVFAKSDQWEAQNKASLTAESSRDGLKLLWFATGKEDFLLDRTKETVAIFKNNQFKPEFKLTEGGHTWINWQLYLNEFVPMLFK